MCRKVVQLGENLDRYECWLRDNFWFKQPFTTFDIQYGFDEEPNDVLACSNLTLWCTRVVCELTKNMFI